MAFLHTFEMVDEYPADGRDRFFSCYPIICYVFTSVWHALSLSLCSQAGNLEINLKMLCFVILAFVACGWQVM